MTETMDLFQRADYTQTSKGLKISLPDGEIAWVNSIYQVNMKTQMDRKDNVLYWHLSIKRRDKSPVIPWRHKQWIKNELCGDECTAIEVFPPESKLVDTANQFHLWVFPDPDLLPFIWQTRLVAEDSIGGAVQEPWPDDRRPKDLIPAERMETLASEARKELGYTEVPE